MVLRCGRCFNMSESVWICLNLSESVWICLNMSKSVQICLNLFQLIWHLKLFDFLTYQVQGSDLCNMYFTMLCNHGWNLELSMFQFNPVYCQKYKYFHFGNLLCEFHHVVQLKMFWSVWIRLNLSESVWIYFNWFEIVWFFKSDDLLLSLLLLTDQVHEMLPHLKTSLSQSNAVIEVHVEDGVPAPRLAAWAPPPLLRGKLGQLNARHLQVKYENYSLK